VSEPLTPKSKIGYIYKNPAFVSSSGEHNDVGYESDEDTVLKKLREGRYPIQIKDCGDNWVSDGIGEGFKHWRPSQPIFISSQTGFGKNTFIECDLIQYLYDLNYDNGKLLKYKPDGDKKILILTNRIALSKQINERIGNIVGEVAEVVSYQSFIDKEMKWKRYSYVVCDESHFFTSDAMFNPHTDLILDKIVRKFRNAIRIYMSSTLCTCIQYILDKERSIERFEVMSKGGKDEDDEGVYIAPSFLYYKFDRDYSYLNVHYFDSFTDLEDGIKDSVAIGEKWLIFLDDKDGCEDLKETLEPIIIKVLKLEADDEKKKKSPIMVIHSGSKGKPSYEEFVLKEKFEGSILITTSVIDNGVNIKDSKVKHIVVTDINKDKVLQMLGRKRVEDNEIVNLYLMRSTTGKMKKLIDGLILQKDAYHRYDLAYVSGTNKDKEDFLHRYYNELIPNFEGAKHWFYREKDNPEQVRPNEIARSLVEKVLLPRYTYIRKRMEETGIGDELLAQQVGWLNRTIDECTFVVVRGSEEAIARFESYSYSLIGRRITSEEIKKFSVEFFNEYIRAYEPRPEDRSNMSRVRNEGYGFNTINKILESLGINVKLKKVNEDWAFIKKG
jgi:hypothetical protein